MSHLGGTFYIRANVEGDGSRGARRKGEGCEASKREKYFSPRVCVRARDRHGQPKLNEPTRDPKLANFLKTQRRLVLPLSTTIGERPTTYLLFLVSYTFHVLVPSFYLSLSLSLFVVPLQRIAANQLAKFSCFGERRLPTIAYAIFQECRIDASSSFRAQRNSRVNRVLTGKIDTILVHFKTISRQRNRDARELQTFDDNCALLSLRYLAESWPLLFPST